MQHKTISKQRAGALSSTCTYEEDDHLDRLNIPSLAESSEHLSIRGKKGRQQQTWRRLFDEQLPRKKAHKDGKYYRHLLFLKKKKKKKSNSISQKSCEIGCRMPSSFPRSCFIPRYTPRSMGRHFGFRDKPCTAARPSSARC